MARILRSVILTLVFIASTMLALLAWFEVLHSAFPSIVQRSSSFGALEQYMALLVGAPVLSSAGALAYLLYEKQHKNFATLVFALSVGGLLAWMAPTLLVGSRTVLLLAYWLSCAALGSGLIILGAWCTALIRRQRTILGNEA